MKQLYIVSSRGTKVDGLAKGAYAFVPAGSDTPASTATKLTSKFAIYVGGGENVVPYCLPEVDINTLTVQKSTPVTGVAKKVTLTVPTTEKGKVYNFTIVKKGTVLNERYKWSFSQAATGTGDATKIAEAFAKYVNANNGEHKVSATASSATITLQGSIGHDFEVTADFATPSKPSPEYAEATNDSAALKQLASRCAAGKGMNYLAEDGKELYPNYLADIEDGKTYTLYTLRFAVGRDAAKTRDERVWQVVHIAVPDTANITTGLDTELGITAAAATNTVEED